MASRFFYVTAKYGLFLLPVIISVQDAMMKKPLPYDAYDELADSYAVMVDTKPHNALYNTPAVISLLPDVQNAHILDAGCGPGFFTEILLKKGAVVTAFDANEKMIRHARARVGEKVTLLRANMEEPLAFLGDNTVDGVLSSLAVTYVKDHTPLFAEFSRVLHPGGWLVFSTEHPFFSYRYFNIDNYFETREVSCVWKGFGKHVTMPSYYHSLGSIAEALSGNGFVIERILEPRPLPEFKFTSPEDYEDLMKFPLFICIRAITRTA
ncbi:MAG: methyltransferase domain-containing protein [Spirochaetales bacterium]|nr:methyltransferase domain-containing protein [Spirochaetales bacterium]